MRIRAITLGIPMNPAGVEAQVEAAGAFLARAAIAFRSGGFEVDTLRLTTQPVDQVLTSPTDLAGYGTALAQAATRAGIDYAALGPARLAHPDASLVWIDAVVTAILINPTLFGSVQIGLAGEGVSGAAARACAAAVLRIARETDQGFGNLRFAVQACTPPGGPFFPTGYHDEGPPRFSIALEAADLAVEAFGEPTLDTCRDALLLALETAGLQLMSIAQTLVDDGQSFGGIDVTLAPFPSPDRSIVAALERLGVHFGGPGTLAAVAFLADALRRVDLPRCGFSWVMLPLLEDDVLAARQSEGLVSLEGLLLASTVCGTGLDTIPLPGDISEAAVAGILLDLAALAVVLDKPLTARLMPVPGLVADEPTAFTFPYFANSTPAKVRAPGPGGALGGVGWLDLAPRSSNR
ncbi:MAG: DUF711 family protein [Dehalococcoidia bacterium]